MVKIGDLIRQVLREHLFPRLKADGFKRRNTDYNWHRSEDPWFAVLQVQRGSYEQDDDSYGSFDLNVGVLHREVAALGGGLDLPKKLPPKPHQCPLRKGSRSWFIKRDTDLDALGGEVLGLWDEQLQPWLQEATTLEGMGRLGGHHIKASVAILQGDLELATDHAVRCLDTTYGRGDRRNHPRYASVHDWASMRGLTIPDRPSQWVLHIDDDVSRDVVKLKNLRALFKLTMSQIAKLRKQLPGPIRADNIYRLEPLERQLLELGVACHLERVEPR